jgi:branched-chain amino acid transport system substrate-binding protein
MRARLTSVIVLTLLVTTIVTGCAAPPAAPTQAPAAPPTQAPATQAPPTPLPPTAPPTEKPAAPKATEVPPTAAPTAVPAPAAPECIEVGSSIPLTGKFGSLGTQVKPGYAYAVEDINAGGGVYVKEFDKKIPLCLTVYDDESDPTKAVSKLETVFSDKNVVAYLGGAGSDMHAATAAIAEKNKVPYCGIAFALWQIHQQGYKYLFSPFVKSPAQGKDVYEYLNAAIPEGQRPTKVAVFQEKTDWGKELGGLWKENAPKYGYEVVDLEEYAPGTKDYSGMILKAKAAGADALFGMPTQPDGVAMFKQMSELGWTPKFSLIIRAPENVKWSETLGKTGDYVTIFPGWHNAMKFPGVAELNAKYQAEFGRPADLLTGPAYACVQIVANAIEKAGTLDRDKIRDAMAATDMETVIGPVTFNPDGTGVVIDPLIQWQNGKLELVAPPEHATAKLAYPAPPFEQR